MHDIPEEAVKAAMDAHNKYYGDLAIYPSEEPTPEGAFHEALKAALPFLSALEPSAARDLALEEGFRKGLEAACEVIDAHSEYDRQLCCDGRECGCYGATVHQSMQHYIRALSSPDHAVAGKVEGDGWLPIESAPTDETLFLAYCPSDEDFPDGRMMIWKGSIFAFQKNPTPNHLQFPATHWRPLPSAPSGGDRHGE